MLAEKSMWVFVERSKQSHCVVLKLNRVPPEHNILYLVNKRSCQLAPSHPAGRIGYTVQPNHRSGTTVRHVFKTLKVWMPWITISSALSQRERSPVPPTVALTTENWRTWGFFGGGG